MSFIQGASEKTHAFSTLEAIPSTPEIHDPSSEGKDSSSLDTRAIKVAHDIFSGAARAELTPASEDKLKTAHEFSPRPESPLSLIDSLIQSPLSPFDSSQRYSPNPSLTSPISDRRIQTPPNEDAVALIRSEFVQQELFLEALIVSANKFPPEDLEPTKRLLDQYKKLVDGLIEKNSSEDFQKECIGAKACIASLADAPSQLIQRLLNRTVQRIQKVSHHLPYTPDEIAPQKLFRRPKKGHEAGWIKRLGRYYENLLPFETIVDWVHEFLDPYLDGRITRETENIHRQQVKGWLLPKLIERFPLKHISSRVVDHIALSTYLKYGARGLNFQGLKATYDHYMGFDIPEKTIILSPARLLPDESDYEYRMASEVIATAQCHLHSYTESLKHSLRIDFTDYTLCATEIELLARYALVDPTAPFPENWRSQVQIMRCRKKPIGISERMLPWSWYGFVTE